MLVFAGLGRLELRGLFAILLGDLAGAVAMADLETWCAREYVKDGGLKSNWKRHGG